MSIRPVTSIVAHHITHRAAPLRPVDTVVQRIAFQALALFNYLTKSAETRIEAEVVVSPRFGAHTTTKAHNQFRITKILTPIAKPSVPEESNLEAAKHYRTAQAAQFIQKAKKKTFAPSLPNKPKSPARNVKLKIDEEENPRVRTPSPRRKSIESPVDNPVPVSLSPLTKPKEAKIEKSPLELKHENQILRKEIAELCGKPQEAFDKAHLTEIMQAVNESDLKEVDLINRFLETEPFNHFSASRQVSVRQLLTKEQLLSRLDFISKETPNTFDYLAASRETRSRIFYSTLSQLESLYGLKVKSSDLKAFKSPEEALASAPLKKLSDILKRNIIDEEKELIHLLIHRFKACFTSR
jgi:hypothetical protein